MSVTTFRFNDCSIFIETLIDELTNKKKNPFYPEIGAVSVNPA